MRDVAAASGVSYQTVSRVLNDHPRVAPQTRARVQAAIVELGYRRNLAARTLATRRSGTIGVVTPRSSQFGPANTIMAIEAAARSAGLSMSLVSVADDTRLEMRSALEHFLRQHVEGIVVLSTSVDMDSATPVAPLGVPVVSITPLSHARPGVAVTAIDQVLGAQLAVTHLVDQGATSIAHVSGPADSLDATARMRGWQSTLIDRRLQLGPLITGDWSAASGYRAGQRLAAQAPPDAVFCGNDEMAIGLLLALQDAGHRVPEDISVVGFDDIPGAGYLTPPLTTVRQDFHLLGRRCIDLLTTPTDTPPESVQALIRPELVVRRSSTAGPR